MHGPFWLPASCFLRWRRPLHRSTFDLYPGVNAVSVQYCSSVWSKLLIQRKSRGSIPSPRLPWMCAGRGIMPLAGCGSGHLPGPGRPNDLYRGPTDVRSGRGGSGDSRHSSHRLPVDVRPTGLGGTEGCRIIREARRCFPRVVVLSLSTGRAGFCIGPWRPAVLRTIPRRTMELSASRGRVPRALRMPASCVR